MFKRSANEGLESGTAGHGAPAAEAAEVDENPTKEVDQLDDAASVAIGVASWRYSGRAHVTKVFIGINYAA